MRQVFDDKEVQAVAITLPNHWHALATIWACQAGKDVYVEKPACYSPYEGWKMIEAARKYVRRLGDAAEPQFAAQNEGNPDFHCSIIRKVYLAKGLYKCQPSVSQYIADSQAPAWIDWDKFLGPAAMRPYNESRYHYNWNFSGDGQRHATSATRVRTKWTWRGGAWENRACLQALCPRVGEICIQRRIRRRRTQIATYGTAIPGVFEVRRGLTTGGEGAWVQSYIRDLNDNVRKFLERLRKKSKR